MTTPRWYMLNKMGMATLCANKADAEKEAADAQRFWPHMGPHRAVQLVEAADVEAMRTGYAAARLEIESLRARSVEPVGEYPALPEPDRVMEDWSIGGVLVDYFTTDQMRAYADATHALRASHGQAPAQAALAAQHETYGWQLVPIEVTDDMLAAFANCVSPEFGWNRATEAEHQEVRDSFGPAYRAMLAAAATPQADSQPAVDALAEAEYFIDNPSAWSNFDQRASDAMAAVCKAFRAARAPADSVTAPATGAVAGPGWKLVPVEPTPEMLRAGDQKTWVLPALDCWRAMLAAAPTPPAQAADSVLEDAARYRWLKSQSKEQLLNPRGAASEFCADMRTHWKLPVLMCSGPIGGYLSFDDSVDILRAAQEGK